MDKINGFIRVGAAVPSLKVADIDFNIEEIKKCMQEASEKGVEITVFPELSITAYTAGDLFLNNTLLREALNGLISLQDYSKTVKGVFIVGVPIKADNQLFNCAAVIENGKILGIVPKTYIPNYSEFYEKRWFASSNNKLSDKLVINGLEVPFKTELLFQKNNCSDVKFGVELCEDLWGVLPPSLSHTLNGANMIFNLSASNELIGKKEERERLVNNQSEKTISAYVYASSGPGESTSDLVFSGASMISENGHMLKRGDRFNFESTLIYSDVDVYRLNSAREKNTSYMGVLPPRRNYETVQFQGFDRSTDLERIYEEYPFVPNDEKTKDDRFKEILTLQAMGLAKRLKHTNSKSVVIGISGGLDSTLAFLVAVKAFDILGLDRKNIIGITMPGFGTTGRTYNNSCLLVENYGATLKEINIKDACVGHLKDIGHDINVTDVTYENAQARERTQILMDYANQCGGLVIGTGDLSELALGWCTYNGDHMSMYAVNSGVPKTLVRYLVHYYAKEEEDKNAKKVLNDILNTPVSPELLPPSEAGEILQKTENTIGPYVLHDFFLYHFLKYGAEPEKIFYIACHTFKQMDKNEIKKWLLVFLRRFFTQQFKRNCVPDGPKVGSISLSPRGDLRMPSDAEYRGWVKKIEKL